MNERRQSSGGIRDVKYLPNPIDKRIARYSHFLCALSVDVRHLDLDRPIVEARDDLLEFSFEIWIRSLASLICSAISKHSIDCILHTAREREWNLGCRWGDTKDRCRSGL